MADFTALKTAIQTYIKQNGNEEITGEKLQEILLSVVTTLGDSAINDLVTALANEVAARQNADGTLQQNITNEAAARGNADTALGGRIDDEATARANGDTALSNRLGSSITAENTAADQIGAEAEARAAADTALQGLIDGITDNIENGYVYAGIATPSSTPATGKVFYLALTAGTYTNFGSTEVSQGINILKYNGSAWSLDAFIGIDDTPTPNSPKLVKSGGTFDSIMTDGSAFDISAHFASGGTLATYADLSAALAALNTLSAYYKRGGMSIKYVQSSDNIYVQYRLIANSFATNEIYWQGVDVEPADGSINLVESGGVERKITIVGKNKYDESKRIDGKTINSDGSISNNQYYHLLSNKIYLEVDSNLHCSAWSNYSTVYYCYYDANNVPIGTRISPEVTHNGSYYEFDIPYLSGADYVLINTANPMTNSHMQVELGDERTAYKPYKKETVRDINTKTEKNAENVNSLNIRLFGYETYLSGTIVNKYPTSGGTIGNVQKGSVLFDVSSLNDKIIYVSSTRSKNQYYALWALTLDNETTVVAYGYALDFGAPPYFDTIDLNKYPNATKLFVSTEEGSEATAYYNINGLGDIPSLNKKVSDLGDEIKSKLAGKKIVCFGDSITALSYNDKHYTDYLAEKTGANVYNIAKGGAMYRQRLLNSTSIYPIDSSTKALAWLDVVNMVRAFISEDWSKQIEACQYLEDSQTLAFINAIANLDPEDVDVITLFAGTNDYGDNTEDLYFNYHYGTMDSLQYDTTLGAVNYIVKTIHEAYPKINIMIFTPIVRYFGNISLTFDDTKWSDNADGNGHITFVEHVENIKRLAIQNHVPVCDMYYAMNWDKYNWANVCVGTDGTHPYKGLEEIANRFISFIDNYIR